MNKIDVKREGSCLCGRVRIYLSGSPLNTVLCHCSSCQKASGVVFESNIVFSQEQLQVLDPGDVLRAYEDCSPDSGNTLMRWFCSYCGSRVKTINSTNPSFSSFVLIPMGVIDGDKTDLQPANEFYVKRRVNWVHGILDSDEHQEMP